MKLCDSAAMALWLGGERRVDVAVLVDLGDAVDPQPLAHHTHQPRARIERRKQAPQLLLAAGGSDQRVDVVEQRLVGRRRGRHVRQQAGDLVRGQRGLAGRAAGGAVAQLGQIDEARRLQDRPGHEIDPVVVAPAVACAGAVEGQQRIDVVGGERPPVGPGAERLNEGARAGLAVAGGVAAGSEEVELPALARRRDDGLGGAVELDRPAPTETTCASLTVKPSLWVASRGKPATGVSASTPRSANTEAAYSALVSRRTRAGSSGLSAAVPPPPAPAARPPSPRRRPRTAAAPGRAPVLVAAATAKTNAGDDQGEGEVSSRRDTQLGAPQ